jgi:hypothetical protein
VVVALRGLIPRRRAAKLDPQKYAGQYNRKINRKDEEGYRF